MDRYRRVEKPREEAAIGANEIRITAQGRTKNYITYALSLLQDNATDDIVIKAMGNAINKTVAIVELLKRRIAGLHQNNSIESIDITETWEPLEEGLTMIETTRHVSLITITLSKKELDVSSPGYQSPIPVDQVRPPTDVGKDAEEMLSGRGRGRGHPGRGRGRGFSNEGADYDNESGDVEGPQAYSGRGRGRGRGRRGNFGPGRGDGGDGNAMEGTGEYHGLEHNAPAVQGYEGDGGRGRGRRRRGRGGRARGSGRGSQGPLPQD